MCFLSPYRRAVFVDEVPVPLTFFGTNYVFRVVNRIKTVCDMHTFQQASSSLLLAKNIKPPVNEVPTTVNIGIGAPPFTTQTHPYPHPFCQWGQGPHALIIQEQS